MGQLTPTFKPGELVTVEGFQGYGKGFLLLADDAGFQEITGVSRVTASRELAALVKKGILKPTGTGKRDLRY